LLFLACFKDILYLLNPDERDVGGQIWDRSKK